MEVTNRGELIACLDRFPDRNGLEVSAFAKRHLLAVVDEAGFADYGGHDYEVLGRLARALAARTSDSALWGLVCLDLWYCNNFGHWHWDELLARDPGAIRFAIQAAHWVFAVSGADGGLALAAMFNRRKCWRVAERYIPRESGNSLRLWWTRNVLPRKRKSFA